MGHPHVYITTCTMQSIVRESDDCDVVAASDDNSNRAFARFRSRLGPTATHCFLR